MHSTIALHAGGHQGGRGPAREACLKTERAAQALAGHGAPAGRGAARQECLSANAVGGQAPDITLLCPCTGRRRSAGTAAPHGANWALLLSDIYCQSHPNQGPAPLCHWAATCKLPARLPARLQAPCAADLAPCRLRTSPAAAAARPRSDHTSAPLPAPRPPLVRRRVRPRPAPREASEQVSAHTRAVERTLA